MGNDGGRARAVDTGHQRPGTGPGARPVRVGCPVLPQALNAEQSTSCWYNTEMMVTVNERRATLPDAQAAAKAWESADAHPGRLAQTRKKGRRDTPCRGAQRAAGIHLRVGLARTALGLFLAYRSP